MNSLLILSQALGLFFAADLVTRIVHWLEDIYDDESMPVIGRQVARTNIVDHHFPRHFTRLTWPARLVALLSANAYAIHNGRSDLRGKRSGHHVPPAHPAAPASASPGPALHRSNMMAASGLLNL